MLNQCETCHTTCEPDDLTPVHWDNGYEWICGSCAKPHYCEIHGDHCSDPQECLQETVSNEMLKLAVDMPEVTHPKAIAYYIVRAVFPDKKETGGIYPMTKEILESVKQFMGDM